MNRFDEFKKGETWYVCLALPGSKGCKDIGFIKGLPALRNAIKDFLASKGKGGEKSVKVMFLRNIMDEDVWFSIPVSYHIEIQL